MTTTRNKSGFYIGVTCPGCGGELEIESNFFTLTCEYCGSVLRIKMPDTPPAYLIKGRLDKREIRFGIDRYLKKQNLPLTDANLQIGYIKKARKHVLPKMISGRYLYNHQGKQSTVSNCITRKLMKLRRGKETYETSSISEPLLPPP